jgi:hypothetical protein
VNKSGLLAVVVFASIPREVGLSGKRWLRVSLLVSFLSPLFPAVAGEPPEVSSGSCVQLTALEPRYLLEERTLLAAQTTAAKPGAAKPAGDKTHRHPMTEEELRQMLANLEPVKVQAPKDAKPAKGAKKDAKLPKDEDVWTIRALSDRNRAAQVNFERMGVVLGDAVTLLAILKSRDTLGQLKGSKGFGAADMKWMESAYKSIQRCAELRYKDYGGDPTFKASLKIVEKFRPQLESLILEGLKTGTLVPAGGGRP